MIIGIPKEIKDNEYRVAMTPGGVRQLTQSGHQVRVETGRPGQRLFRRGVRGSRRQDRARGRRRLGRPDGGQGQGTPARASTPFCVPTWRSSPTCTWRPTSG